MAPLPVPSEWSHGGFLALTPSGPDVPPLRTGNCRVQFDSGETIRDGKLSLGFLGSGFDEKRLFGLQQLFNVAKPFVPLNLDVNSLTRLHLPS